MELVLSATQRSEEVRELARIYGIAQLFVIGSTTSAGLLHAKGSVNEMSVLTIVTKLIWGLGVALAMFLGLGLWAYGLALAVSEGVKSTLLFGYARRHLQAASAPRPESDLASARRFLALLHLGPVDHVLQQDRRQHPGGARQRP